MLNKLPENDSGFLAYRGTAQSIPHGGSAFTTIIYSTEVYDLLGEYDHTTGVFTSKYGGTYVCCWNALLTGASWAVGEYFLVSLSVDGSDFWTPPSYAGQLWQCTEATSEYANSNGSCSVHLEAGGTLSAGAYQTQGAAINLEATGQYNYFSAHKIGP